MARQEKILPPLLVGDPPSYRTILDVGPTEDEPVGWDIFLNGKRLGGAVTRTARLADGINQLYCRVVVRELPLAELTPAWIGTFMKVMDSHRTRGAANIGVESEVTIDIDPLNRPINFLSTTRIGPPENDIGHRSLLAGMDLTVVMRGKMVGDVMHILMHSGEIEYHTQVTIPPDALIGDVLSPQTRLPGFA